MEEANMKSSWKEEEVMLPGFRFHPTDEELISFYLRQKVEKKPISIEIIKQIDIYKYDPWDLPKEASNGGEWYFFCKRGRKYRNSIRPNRVTGSGFWKATGIDKPIYAAQQPHHRIGLKKSLVYYFGSAGKGTKTDWMMHEFRLPPNGKDALANVKVEHIALEAEVWTLCRIFKRNPSNKKYTSPAAWKNATSTRKHNDWGSSGWRTSSCSLDNGYTNKKCTSTLCDSDSVLQLNHSKPNTNTMEQMDGRNHHFWTDSISAQQAQIAASGDSTASSCGPNGDVDVFRNGNWDELGHVVELALEHSPCF